MFYGSVAGIRWDTVRYTWCGIHALVSGTKSAHVRGIEQTLSEIAYVCPIVPYGSAAVSAGIPFSRYPDGYRGLSHKT